ncbi:MAG: hypothetical protein WC516_02950 [Patescibacteria group bacterium]
MSISDASGFSVALAFSIWVIFLGAYRLGRGGFVIRRLESNDVSRKNFQLIAVGIAAIVATIVAAGIGDWRYHQRLRAETVAATAAVSALEMPPPDEKTVSLVMDTTKVDKIEFINVDTRIVAGMLRLNKTTDHQEVVINGEWLRFMLLNRPIGDNLRPGRLLHP